MSIFEYTGEVTPPVNVLADRYASPEMVALFSDEAKVFMERGLWIAVMRKQAELGMNIPESAISDYEAVQGEIDLDAIREREKLRGHDVKAMIEIFDEAAGHQYAHDGMTSRDLTENIEQYQVLRGLGIIRDRVVSTLDRFASRAIEHESLPMAGRTHNVAAQTITMGKRFANFGEELLGGYHRLTGLIGEYSLRGIKGPVGTQQDMLDRFGGDKEKVRQLEEYVARQLGFTSLLGSVGQIYPRSMDFDVVTALKQITTGPTNFANTVRLMAGQELATEGFKPGQVGSSAMPHKMNASKSERIAGLSAVLTGHVATAAEVSARQWNEGDVSCSAARRVIIPDAFFAADGLLQTTMTILDRYGAYPAVIDKEMQRYLPFLTTAKVLTACTEAGMGREDAHEKIKDHAVAVALEMRDQGTAENDLFDRLDSDPDLPVTKEMLITAVGEPLNLTGLAVDQVRNFAKAVEPVLEANPDAAGYKPAAVL